MALKQWKKHMSVFVIVIFVLLPFPIKAENDNSLLAGYTLTIGASAKELVLNYYRSADDSDPAGIMTEGLHYTYLLRASSPYSLRENSRWGYYFETGFSNYSLSKQNVGEDTLDLGTSVSGTYWYVTPIGFYLYGPVPGEKKELSILTGIGVGLGYLRAKGSMMLTEDGSNLLHNVDKDEIDIAASILIEAYYGHWVSRIYGGGPYTESRQDAYSIVNFSWDVGYTFVF